MRIGIAGMDGRVGRLLIDEVRASSATLVGGIGRPGALPSATVPGVVRFDCIETLAPAVDAVIDFSHADAVIGHAAALAGSGTAWVLGTTGLSTAAQTAVEHAARFIAVVQAANFSPGVALVLDLAARLAAALPAEQYDAEIMEMHHRQKRDAPSGTALSIGEAVRRGRGEAPADHAPTTDRTGPRASGVIGYAALRGGQIVGEHTLLFTTGSEQICISHRAFDRRVFASGALRAALWTEARAPGLYGMHDVLQLGSIPFRSA